MFVCRKDLYVEQEHLARRLHTKTYFVLQRTANMVGALVDGTLGTRGLGGVSVGGVSVGGGKDLCLLGKRLGKAEGRCYGNRTVGVVYGLA